jgi:1-acyl-sn-glycerol-3-phosphate acyltransferase
MSSVEQPGTVNERGRGSWFTRLCSYFLFVPLIYLYTGVMGSLSLLSSFVDRDGRIQHWFARTWSKMILQTLRVHTELEGSRRVDFTQPAVYAANHLSALDIPLLYASLPIQFRILAKKELFRYPFLGWHLKRSGQIPVDQSDARASLRSLNRAGETLRHGMPLVVFPEGGRSPDGQLQPFMGGAFYAAIKAQVPVVPVVLVGARELLPMNSFHALPGTVHLVFCDPVSTEGMAARQMDQLSEQVRQVMTDVYYAHSTALPEDPVHHEGADSAKKA